MLSICQRCSNSNYIIICKKNLWKVHFSIEILITLLACKNIQKGDK